MSHAAVSGQPYPIAFWYRELDGLVVVTSPCSFWSMTSSTRGLIPHALPTFEMMVDAGSFAAPTYAWVQFDVAARFGVDAV